MAKMKGAIVVDTERCKGCQLCIIACPQKVIALANKVNLHGYPYVAAIRCGCDGYFGYPITPQSEVIETLAELKPWETTGMQVVQAESELASIYMVYGAAGAGKRAMTSSSSPGIALMQEGITYMAGAEVPGVFVNVQRGGPGLSSLHRVTISRLPVVVVMVTIR